MAEQLAPTRLKRFGVYEFDSNTRELYRNGYKLKLAGQPIEVLALLLEHPGELITRETLQHRLWPNNDIVEFEHCINTAIMRVREVLDDSADEPRFIETLPRRGYRFIGPVECVAPVSPPAVSAAAKSSSPSAGQRPEAQRPAAPSAPQISWRLMPNRVGFSAMAEARRFRIGLIQMACTPSPEENLGRAMARIGEAASAGVQVICLPELFRSQYFCQREDHASFDLAEPIPGPTTEALSSLAKKLGVVIIAPVFERRAAGLYHNSAAVIDSTGEIAGLYRKMHIPDDPAYYEKFYFTPGDLGFRAFDTAAGSIGTLICWDQWYPEGARLTALQGANILFYPTAIGWHPDEKEQYGAAQRDAWRTIQRAHAIANGVYVAAVNRVGFEKLADTAGKGIEFWGSSFICDPFGVVIAEAAPDREEIICAEADLGRVEKTRQHWPFLRDRRIDAYAGLDQRFLDGPLSD